MNAITTLLESIIDQASTIGVEAEALPMVEDARAEEAEMYLRSAAPAPGRCGESLRRVQGEKVNGHGRR